MRTTMIWLGAAFVAAMMASALAAAIPSVGAVQALSPGRWTLHEAGTTVADGAICVRNPAVLLQMRHPGALCDGYVVENSGRDVTVAYQCGGAGQGRTSIHIQDRDAIHLTTQGVAGGAPFYAEYDVRRTGPCAR